MKIQNKNLVSLVIRTMMIFSSFSALGQIPMIGWERCYGGAGVEWAYDIEATADGGFVIAGSAGYTVDGDVSEGFGSLDFWIIKISSDGELQWEKSLGGNGYDVASSIKQTPDGGYIVTGTTTSNNHHVSGNHGAKDYWVVKLAFDGAIEWQQCYGGPGDDEPIEIEVIANSGYAIVGYSSANGGDVNDHHGSLDGWLVKINETGQIEWQKCLGGSNVDLVGCVKQTVDGGYIVSGQASSIDGDLSANYGYNDLWVIKLDSFGNIEWQRVYGGSSEERGSKVIITSDNKYLLAGYSASSDGDVSGQYAMGDFWMVKLAEEGTIIWQKPIGGNQADILYNASKTSDNGYLLSGFSRSSDGDVTNFHGGLNDYWVVKTNEDGALEWQISLGGSSHEQAKDAIETSDGGFIVIGYTESNDGDVSNQLGIGDFWVVKIIGPNGLGYLEQQESKVELYPNPSSNHVNLTNIPQNSKIIIRNSLGAIVKEIETTSSSHIIQTDTLAQGIYYVQLNKLVKIQKLIIIR